MKRFAQPSAKTAPSASLGLSRLFASRNEKRDLPVRRVSGFWKIFISLLATGITATGLFFVLF